MQIINTTTRDLGLSPEIVVPARGMIEIDNDRLSALKASPVVKAWLLDGSLLEDGAVEPPAEVEPQADAPTDREAIIAGIIRGLDPESFTKGGKPEVDAINAVMPKEADPVTAAERDAVWAQMGESAA